MGWTVPAEGEVSGPKGPPWELRDGDIFQCMTASTSLARAAARQCSLCEQGPAPIEVRCRHSNASRAALWLQQKHCAAVRSLCSKGDITIELAGIVLINPACSCVSVPAQGWALSNRVYPLPLRPRLPVPAGFTKSSMTVFAFSCRRAVNYAQGE